MLEWVGRGAANWLAVVLVMVGTFALYAAVDDRGLGAGGVALVSFALALGLLTGIGARRPLRVFAAYALFGQAGPLLVLGGTGPDGWLLLAGAAQGLLGTALLISRPGPPRPPPRPPHEPDPEPGSPLRPADREPSSVL